ncbi:energy transducer TonB [Saccharicrinis aurantiacus]|uniref:energy transducer TonB n=1 Tax=Saccharicrinis aurantiacus TaxID=1849719 RepID=UPI0008382BA0|nr:energy transducer TonB [Saccharicrinis aurantiacus]
MKNFLLFIYFLAYSSLAYAQADSAYIIVDKVPVLKQNNGKVQKAINKALQYPFADMIAQIEGEVLVSFVITSEGIMSDIEVVEGLTETLNKEALRAVLLLKKWKPGKLDGELVNTRLTIPVHFKLSAEQHDLANKLKPMYSNGKNPLFVLDNKKVNGLSEIEYFNVRSIRVIKGEKATLLFGSDARDGVVVIETKRGTYPQYQMY